MSSFHIAAARCADDVRSVDGVRASFLPTSLVNLIHMSQVKCQFAHGPDELRVINRHPKC